MPRGLEDLRRLATDIARTENDALDVVAVLTESGGSGYTEILITLRGCAPEECLISLDVNRQVSEAALRVALAEKIRAHLREHAGGDTSPS